MCAFVKDDADDERNAGGEAEEDQARVLDTYSQKSGPLYTDYVTTL
jgi:hypothetical protein